MKEDVELYALRLGSNFFSMCVLAIYRTPIGDSEEVLNKPDCIINYLYKSKA